MTEPSDSPLDAPTQIDALERSGISGRRASSLPSVEGYEILREIGRGGMGLVYLARQLDLDRLVALKTIPHSTGPELAKVLVAEARIAGKLDHPSIVPVYEVNTAVEPWFFSMGYVDGEDLSRRISRQVLRPDEVVELGLAIARALTHAHAQQILHLDIKPANILLDWQQHPKLTDFGLAAVHSARAETMSCFGTPQFMSPEQTLGDRDQIAESSDIYSLGAVLYAALAGRPPIVSSNPDDLMLKVVSQKPTPLRHLGIFVPSPLEAVILKCLEKDPTRRYCSASELRDDLLAYQSGQPVKARAPGLWSSFEYQIKRHVLAASVSGSAVLVLLLLAGWVAIRSFWQAAELDSLRFDAGVLRSENSGLRQALENQLQIREQLRLDNTSTVQAHSETDLQLLADLTDLVSSMMEQGDMDRAAYYSARVYLHSSALQDTGVPAEIVRSLEEYAAANQLSELPLDELAAKLLNDFDEADTSAEGRGDGEGQPDTRAVD